MFDLKMLAADPLFAHLAGGSGPSVDVLYDDLRRFDAPALEDLEELLAEHGAAPLRAHRLREVFVDLDTTVTPLFGTQQGALPGPNPHYRGRASYHPILARIAQTSTIIGARLRPGDRGLGELDVEDVEQWLDRTRAAAGPAALVTMRIDARGDCAPPLQVIDEKGAWFLVKMKQTPNLVSAVCAQAGDGSVGWRRGPCSREPQIARIRIRGKRGSVPVNRWNNPCEPLGHASVDILTPIRSRLARSEIEV